MRQSLIAYVICFMLFMPLWAQLSASQESERAKASEQRRRELQQQLQQTYQAQQDAKLQQAKAQAAADQSQSDAKQQEARAQAAANQSRAEADQQQSDANKAAISSGMEKGAWDAAAQNVDKRLEMVTSAVKNWKPSQGYTAKSASKVALADPYASSATGSLAKDLIELAKALQGTCLAIDDDHGVARVQGDCTKPVDKACRASLPKGTYPVLADGSPIEKAEQVGKFFGSCRSDNEVTVLTPEGNLMIIGVSGQH